MEKGINKRLHQSYDSESEFDSESESEFEFGSEEPPTQRNRILSVDNNDTNELISSNSLTELRDFLNIRLVATGSQSSHFSNVNNPYANVNEMERHFISDSDEPLLKKLFMEVVNERAYPIAIREQHKYFGPVAIQLNFEYFANDIEVDEDEEPGIIPRVYSNQFTKVLIAKYFNFFDTFLDSKYSQEKFSDCVLLQTETPIIVDEVTRKDGLLIQFPNIVTTPKMRDIVRNAVLKDIEVIEAFNKLSVQNRIEEVILDEIHGWMFYASSIYGTSTFHSYRLNVNGSNICGGYSAKKQSSKILPKPIPEGINLLELLSIRSAKLGDLIEQSDEGNAAIIDDTQMREEQNHRDNRDYALNGIAKIIPSIYKSDLNYIRDLVTLLNPKRAKSRNMWLRIGWCLFNIDHTLVESWVNLSKQVEFDTTFDCSEETCRTIWDEMSNATERQMTYGLGTLSMMAKEDSGTKFKKFMRESVWFQIKQCCDKYIYVKQETDKNGNSELKAVRSNFGDIVYYVVDIIKHFAGHLFVCTSYESKNWMFFHNDKWNKSEKGLDLFNMMNEELHFIFSYWATEFRTQSNAVKDDVDEIDKFRKFQYSIACNEFAIALRNPTKKQMILDVCAERMYWSKMVLHNVDEVKSFEELLDSDDYLIGMNRGVYDLRCGEFRSGNPEDYILNSNQISYIKYSFEHPVVQEIEKFMSQIIPLRPLRDFVWKLLASFLDGHLIEKFYIWTGEGGNGKSKLIELFQNTMGDYCGTLPISLLTGKTTSSSKATPEVARMKGRRLGTFNESNPDSSLNMEFFKTTTGGDKIYSRGLFSNPIDFRTTFQLLLLCNKKPSRLAADDAAIWRRMCVIPFYSSFVENPNPNNPNEFKTDRFLDIKMKKWKNAFFWILTQKYKLLQTEGNPEPDIVIDETSTYRNSNDTVKMFVEQYVEISDSVDDVLTKKQLFDKCRIYCVDNNQTLKQNDFYAQLHNTLGEPNLAISTRHSVHKEGWIKMRFKMVE